MAKLYFYYSAMNAGKSTMFLQSSYNYHERGMRTLILTPELDDRFARGKVLGDTEGDLAPMLRLRKFTELGPAVFADSAKYVRRRRLDGVSGSRLRYEVFYAYLLPQFGSLDEDQAYELIDATCELMDPQEQEEVRRVAPALLDLPYMS